MESVVDEEVFTPINKATILLDVYLDNGNIKRDIIVSIIDNKIEIDPSRLEPIEVSRVFKMLNHDNALKNALFKMSQKIPIISTKGSIIKVSETKRLINITEGFSVEKRDIRKD